VTAFRDIEGAVLTLSGYGPLEESLERLAASLGLSDRVTFAGRYTPAETISILAGHDIGVMPFRDVTDNIRLSSPNKLFDYIMAGLAIASSDLPFIGRVVREHNAGKLFPDTTPGGIADTLNSMIRDRDGLLLFRQNARKAVDAGFSWEHQFRNYPWRP